MAPMDRREGPGAQGSRAAAPGVPRAWSAPSLSPVIPRKDVGASRTGRSLGRVADLLLWAVLIAVIGVGAGGCSVSLPWDKKTTTSSTGDVSTSKTDDTASGAGEVFVTDTTQGAATTRTTDVGKARFDTPEAAVKAVVPAGWVVKVASRQADRAEVWAGPPQSEFLTAYMVRKEAGGWVVTEEMPLGVEGSEGGDYLVGGPWYEQDFPEVFEPGSDLYVPFRTDKYPTPGHKGYPSNNAAAATVWLSLGEMLNYLKQGYIVDATSYVTADFYRHFFFDFFNAGEPTDLYEFELTGWQETDGSDFQIWANLYSADAVSSFLRRAVFSGATRPNGTGLIVWVDLWEPIEL